MVNTGETPTQEPSKERRSHYVRNTIALGVAATTASVMALLGLDAERSKALQGHDAPTTSVVDHAITGAQYPQEEAKTREVDPALVEQCRNSKFVVVVYSGTGMENSHYQASVIQKLVKNLDGCVMYHWYGDHYDSEASALSVEDAIEDVTPEGKKKPVVFIGESFGGIAAEDIASEPVIEKSKAVNLVSIIMVATPTDMNDVIQDVFGVPVPLIKDIPINIPHFGGLVVLANAINGQRQRDQLFDPVEWKNTFINARKTRPELMWDELERIREGMQRVRPDVRVDYIGSPDSDGTVNTDQAYARIDNVVTAETQYHVLHDGGHDKGWLLASADGYNGTFEQILQKLFGLAA